MGVCIQDIFHNMYALIRLPVQVEQIAVRPSTTRTRGGTKTFAPRAWAKLSAAFYSCWVIVLILIYVLCSQEGVSLATPIRIEAQKRSLGFRRRAVWASCLAFPRDHTQKPWKSNGGYNSAPGPRRQPHHYKVGIGDDCMCHSGSLVGC